MVVTHSQNNSIFFQANTEWMGRRVWYNRIYSDWRCEFGLFCVVSGGRSDFYIALHFAFDADLFGIFYG